MSNTSMNQNVSISGRRYGVPDARTVEEKMCMYEGPTLLTFTLLTPESGSKSKENLRQHIEDGFKRWLSHLEWAGVISGSSSNETIGSPKSTSPATQSGPNPWDSSQRDRKSVV